MRCFVLFKYAIGQVFAEFKSRRSAHVWRSLNASDFLNNNLILENPGPGLSIRVNQQKVVLTIINNKLIFENPGPDLSIRVDSTKKSPS